MNNSKNLEFKIGDEVVLFNLDHVRNGWEGQVGEIDRDEILVVFRNEKNVIQDFTWINKNNLKSNIKAIRNKKLNELGIY